MSVVDGGTLHFVISIYSEDLPKRNISHQHLFGRPTKTLYVLHGVLRVVLQKHRLSSEHWGLCRTSAPERGDTRARRSWMSLRWYPPVVPSGPS